MSETGVEGPPALALNQAAAAGGDVAYQLTTRLTALEAKVDSHPNTIWSRIGAGAGLLGLAISIANGAFTFADQAFRQPEAEKAADYNAFKADVRSIISINEELMSKISTQAAGAPPVVAMQSANIKVQSVMQDVERLLRILGLAALDPKGKYFIGSYDYAILAQSAYAGGNLKTALQYADQAVKASDNFHTKSEALRSKAIMLFQVGGVGGVSAAEAALDEAIDSLAQHKEFGVEVDRGALYATRSSIEAYAGQCDAAHVSAAKSMSEVSGEDIPLQSRAYIASMIANGLQGQQRCSLQAFPPAIRALSNAQLAPAAASTGVQQSVVASPAPPIIGAAIAPTTGPQSVRLSLLCRFDRGPRAGGSQSYAGMPGVSPVPVGTACQDGQGSFGHAE